MRSASKILVFSTLGALLIAGAALVLVDQDEVSAVGAESPVVAIQSYGSETDEDAVLVTANVSGESVPLSGVRVTVCRMNVSGEGEKLTFRVMEAVTLQTGADGRAMYNFSEGSKYMVCAENQERRGFANMNMDQNEAGQCNAHEWNWSNMNGQTFTHHGSGQGGPVDQLTSSARSMSGDRDRDRVRAQDRSCC